MGRGVYHGGYGNPTPGVELVLNYGNLVSGFGMAVLEPVAAAYFLDSWGRLKPKRTHNAKSYDHRWKLLLGFIIGLVVLMAVIQVPYIVSRMTGETITSTLHYEGFFFVWGFAVVISPAFIVGGVVVADDKMIKKTAKKPAESDKQEPASNGKGAESGKQGAVTFGNLPANYKLLPTPVKIELAKMERTERETHFPELKRRTRDNWHVYLDKLGEETAVSNGNGQA
jgi:MFS family permease